MIFLIEYDRLKGSMITFEKFRNKEKAQKRRLALELELNRKNIVHEVVLLEANNADTLKQTHQRYFKSLNYIISSTGKS